MKKRLIIRTLGALILLTAPNLALSQIVDSIQIPPLPNFSKEFMEEKENKVFSSLYGTELTDYTDEIKDCNSFILHIVRKFSDWDSATVVKNMRPLYRCEYIIAVHYLISIGRISNVDISRKFYIFLENQTIKAYRNNQYHFWQTLPKELGGETATFYFYTNKMDN